MRTDHGREGHPGGASGAGGSRRSYAALSAGFGPAPAGSEPDREPCRQGVRGRFGAAGMRQKCCGLRSLCRRGSGSRGAGSPAILRGGQSFRAPGTCRDGGKSWRVSRLRTPLGWSAAEICCEIRSLSPPRRGWIRVDPAMLRASQPFSGHEMAPRSGSGVGGQGRRRWPGEDSPGKNAAKLAAEEELPQVHQLLAERR